jgi:NTE family protein
MKRHILFILSLLLILSVFSKPKVGLALSGGGARGLAHIGMLKVIDEMNIKIDFVVGTSIGSVIGGLYALGYSATEIEQIIMRLDWQEIMSSKIKRQNLSIAQKRWLPYANYYFDLNEQFIPTLPQAFLSGNSLINEFFNITKSAALTQHFDDMPIPFKAIVTNVVTGEMVAVDDWKLYEAMRASMSFPTILQPFEKEGCLYIDGGIRGNFPVEVVKQMGADIVIGFQTSSGLKEKKELQSLIDVLDQTINIGISENVKTSLEECAIVIKPVLEDIQLLDFAQKKEIIKLGEEAARKYFSELNKLPKKETATKQLEFQNTIQFSDIRVIGRNHLSSAKIREYIGLKKNEPYTFQDISEAFVKAYHSALFETIYPVLKTPDNRVILEIHVKEKQRNRIGTGFSYRNGNEMNVNVVLEMNNYFQPNSKFLSNLKLGAENEFNVDYVKNFGKYWGIYFRLFPNVKEYRLHLYNTEHEKVSSVRSLRYGATAGIGAFADQAVAMEAYLFADKLQLYQDVGVFESTSFSSSGAGIKLYHESLNDVLFPMQGAQGLIKFTLNRKGFCEGEFYKKLDSRFRFIIPFSSQFVSEYRFEYGSYFKRSEFVEYDPFYIGGLDSFLGLRLRERSAPIYKINSFLLRFKIKNNSYLTAAYNVLQLGDIDQWDFFETDVVHGFGVELGFDFMILPVRLAAAINQQYNLYYYLSVGYDFDPFVFSRK